MTQIKLQNSFLCADCETISDSANQCPCGSQHGLLSLSTVLNRPEQVADIRAEVQKLLDLIDEGCQ